MGKYLPNMVHKDNEREVFSFIYSCLLPIMNIVVVCIGLCELVDVVMYKIIKYIKRWL